MPIESAGTQAKSYRYLRIAMVGLLIALAAAVFYQSSQQGSFLASVSAYYYTPAQAVFVGALIGLGACMIALQGLTDAEDQFLNLGGIFAIVVAIVPTGRGADFQTAVQACRESGGTLLTQRASANLELPNLLLVGKDLQPQRRSRFHELEVRKLRLDDVPPRIRMLPRHSAACRDPPGGSALRQCPFADGHNCNVWPTTPERKRRGCIGSTGAPWDNCFDSAVAGGRPSRSVLMAERVSGGAMAVSGCNLWRFAWNKKLLT